MTNLPEDYAFIRRMRELVHASGLMREAHFDAVTCRFVGAGLRLDLLNVWHTTQQLKHPDTETIVAGWLRPKQLGQACYFGRVDVVERAITSGAPLDGSDFGGDPIAGAIEASVVTELHVECVERLFAAGAEATLAQFESHEAESIGSPLDRELLRLLVEYGRESKDPKVRAKATEVSGR